LLRFPMGKDGVEVGGCCHAGSWIFWWRRG
jgi:hypothetical protein